MVVHAPALHFLSIMGKFGPWKRNVARRWRQVKALRRNHSHVASFARRVSPKQSLQSLVSLRSLQSVTQLTVEDANALIRVVQAAAQDTEAEDTTAWAETAGRKNLFWSGWRQLACRYYKVCAKEDMIAFTDSKQLAVARLRFEKAHYAGRVLNKAPVVKTFSGWHAAAKRIQEGLRTAGVPMLAANLRYTIPWVVRSKLHMEMRRAGVLRLKASRQDRVAKMLTVFPDAKGWLSLFSKGMFMRTLLRELEYDHPIELLTMYFCLFGDDLIKDMPVEELLSPGVERVAHARTAYKHKTGVTACPAIAVRDARLAAKQAARLAAKQAKKQAKKEQAKKRPNKM